MIEKKAAMETGTFLGEFPYVRIGNGRENLVILPGITLENEPPNRIAAWTYRLGFGRFARDYTLYVISRRRGMPSGYTTKTWQRTAPGCSNRRSDPPTSWDSPPGEISPSTWHSIHPASVRGLILVVSACRLSEAGRGICERWQALAREGRWRALRADMASVAVSGETNKRFARAFIRVFGGLVFRVPSDPSDFLTTLDADLRHDTAGQLGGISAPTLVIGGTEDPFFSEALLRETAEKIPDATLRIYEGVGHGVPKERKRRYEEDTLEFLAGRFGGPSGLVGQTTPARAKEAG